MEIRAHLDACLLDPGDVVGEALLVLCFKARACVDIHFLVCLKVDQPCLPTKIQVLLHRVKHLNEYKFIVTEPEYRVLNTIRICHEVRNNNHKRPRFDDTCILFHAVIEPRLSCKFGAVEKIYGLGEISSSSFGFCDIDLFGEGGYAELLIVFGHKICKSERKHGSVLELVPKIHALACVKEYVRGEAFLFLEFLDIELLGPSVHLPVYDLEIVTPGILTVAHRLPAPAFQDGAACSAVGCGYAFAYHEREGVKLFEERGINHLFHFFQDI